jgi:hypothetical protein
MGTLKTAWRYTSTVLLPIQIWNFLRPPHTLRLDIICGAYLAVSAYCAMEAWID